MKGYLTTCDGAQFELPTLLKWEFSYTGSVPCDSFTLRCAYEPAMAEVLRRERGRHGRICGRCGRVRRDM